ncbi:EF-hand calcium-binding domain-containing protein 5-like isoform X2 [Mya arenaria]|uniref:EF-hand calcium-binding domain-containing protein 5-like isoform X2 n=1 Tax=Mya arenaria TaxID=6604 RepID=UPI0022E97F5A|nr:EF-hand calcium-binding domain-containing protein 5-like isoform X2 [Mya arenaria]XP_052802665.1 EF-hand calcium-binding domain-containing protein 5-like isoform X2 [Mya arenaria]
MTDVQKPGTPKRVTMAGEQRASSGSSRGSGKRSGSPEKRVPSAVQRWKRQHEQSMMEKLVGLRNEKKELTKISREQARNVARKIPTELLGRDWLNMIEATLETRAYLVEKLMPTLILGVEKLLNEADKRGLAGKDARDPNFNPINFLAQHLMRNNPRYSNFSEASPYVRTLREITEELKRELFNIEDNRLARIKSEARRRREEREKNEAMKLAERVTRMKMLMDQFKEWSAVPDGTVELQLLQNALRSFVELSEKFPEHLQAAAKLSQPLESTDESGKSLTVKEFAKYVIQYTDELSETLFERFMMHMAKCAAANRSLTMREARRIHLTNLFLSCDHSGIGLLDRHRILSLFENYWDSAKDEIKGNLCNPRKWPVVEVDEADDSISDEDEEQTPTSGGGKTGKPASPVGGKPASPPPNNQEKAQEQTQVTVEQKQEPASGAQEEKKEEPAKTETAEPEKPTEQGKEAEEKKEEKVEDKSEEQKEESKPEEPKAEQTEQKEATDVKPEEAKTEEAKPETEEVKKETEQAKAETATETGTGTGTVEKTETAVGGTGTETDEQVPQTAETGTSREQTQAKADEQTEEGADKEKEGEIEADVALTVDMMKPKTPATAGQQTVQFADGTQFERDNTAMTNVSLATGQSTFDENSLNVSQFVQVTETFLGNEPTFGSFDRLMKYIKSEYQETEDEKMERLMRARKEAMSSRRKMLLDQLFDKWDNDGSGFLDQEEVENVMTKYKDGQESDSIEKAKTEMKKKTKQPQDNRLSRREFRTFVTMVADQMPGADAFEYFVEFLNLSVELMIDNFYLRRTYAERIRGEARKKWLQHIITAADTGGASIDPVYKAVFQALFKDAEAHGGGKNISANIAMLERNNVARDRGDVMLRYVAATTEDADFLLGKILYKDMKGISFSAVESGKPIHVPRVANHGNIMFWNPYRKPDEREGSFIVIPLKDRRKRVFGLLGMDTLADSHTKSIFITHEIQFFQGVSKSFSIAYHSIDLRKKLLRITESAVSWIHRRSPHVKEIVCYIVEPDEESKDFVLRKMMMTDKRGAIQNLNQPPRLMRKDNLFRDYLFKAVDNSESVSADAYGEHHLAFPLRNDQGRTQAILDISIGELKQLPSHENREVQRMLRLLQMAHKEINKEMAGEDKNVVLEAENNEETRMDIMFDRLMLMELRENVTKVDTKAFAELRSYNDPPRIVHDILKSVTAIFSFQETEQGMFDDWQQMKGQINNDLLQKIVAYDPTAGQDLIPPEKIERYLKNVPHGEVAKHSSVPAQHMYNWVFVCLSLIEHTLKMRDNNDDILPPAKDSAEKERTDEQIVSEQTNEQEATS